MAFESSKSSSIMCPLQLTTLSVLKEKQIHFFHMPFSPEAVVSQTMTVCVLLTTCSMPCPMHIVQAAAQRKTERESDSAKVLHKTLHHRASGLEWAKTIWPQGFLHLLQLMCPHTSAIFFSQNGKNSPSHL